MVSLSDILADQFLLTALSVMGALLLDVVLGEPARFHPLVGFGKLARRVEQECRTLNVPVRLQGRIAWFVAVVPLVLLTVGLVYWVESQSTLQGFVVSTLILYLTIGGNSLTAHAKRIYTPLLSSDIEAARYHVSMIVSRNTQEMDEPKIVSAAVESVLENGNDAVFAPIFWFVVAGAPGAVLLRLVNTLDAMWGYKNTRYIDFGRQAAILDDLLGWLPARLTAISYAFFGDIKTALYCWLTQAKKCASPNGGVVMTAGAGALNITIGGDAVYHGVLHKKEKMGWGKYATYPAILKANALVNKSAMCWALILMLIATI